jgi:hypothetical protein
MRWPNQRFKVAGTAWLLWRKIVGENQIKGEAP